MTNAHTPVGHKSLLPDEARQAAKALRVALQPFAAQSPTLPVSYVISFLAVAEKEGRPVSEYANEAGVYKAVMTRHLLDLGERDRRGGEGLMLIDQHRPEGLEGQQVLYQRGAALLSKVSRAWEVSNRKNVNQIEKNTEQ